MGRKKHIENCNDYEKGYIDAKMNQTPIKIDNNYDNQVSLKMLPYKIDIKCKNKKQKDFLNLLKEKNNKICVAYGSAGSGKSWITYSHALSLLKEESSDIDKIIIFIATCQAGSKEINIGLLKGTIEEKTNVFYDASIYTMEKILKSSGNLSAKSTIDSLIKADRIKFDLLQFARGKTFDNAVIIIEEAENVSQEEMRLILTRLGENSRIIILGDEEQKDRKDLAKTDSGMIYAVKNLSEMEEFSAIEFTDEDIVRNPLITKILKLWNNKKGDLK